MIQQMLRPAMLENEESSQTEGTRRIGNLRNELNWYYSLIELEQLRSKKRSPQRVRRLERQARVRERELVRVLRESSSTETAQAGMPGFDRVAFESVRESIAPETLIVEYFQIGDRILACLLDRERLEIMSVGVASRLANVLRLLKFQLSKFRLGPKYAEAFRDSLIQSTRSHLKSLYDELLAPIREFLSARHLVIVPHGALHYVPFHALFDGNKYLIDDYMVSYAPSASIYSVCIQKAVNTFGPTLLMGVPDDKAPLIEHEIRSLSAILPCPQTYLGSSATEQVLRSEGPRSRIVHIATHGNFRRDNPIFSAIRLGSSHLSVYDMYRLQLPAELITLSGCATGLNVVAAGDELIGLARGLFQAGAQSLLLSLWDVHDQSTADFMAAFYQQLTQGKDKANSLRQAMLQLRERYPHPCQWAPFVLMGKYTGSPA